MLCDRIYKLRREAGMSQRELAEKLGVSPSTIGMYEQGRRRPKGACLVELCRMFGVSVDWMLTGAESTRAHSRDLDDFFAQAVSLLAGSEVYIKEGGVARRMTEKDAARLLMPLVGPGEMKQVG